jgi:hypothetical protein
MNQDAEHRIKPVFAFLPASPVWSRPQKSLFVGGARRRRKIGGLTVPWQPLVKLFTPGSRSYTTKIGRGHTGSESRRWVLNSAPVRGNRLTHLNIDRIIFLNIVAIKGAAHIEGIRHPSICIFYTLKGIVSRDFVVCFLVSFDRFDISTHQEGVLFL